MTAMREGILVRGIGSFYTALAPDGSRYELPSPRAAELRRIFDERCEKAGILRDGEVFSWLRSWPRAEKAVQTSLFDGPGGAW